MAEALASTDPATGEQIGTVPIAAAEDVERAVGRAREAQPRWAERTLRDRSSVLEAFAERVLEHRDALARLVAQESGKPVAEAKLADLLPALDMVRYLRAHGRDVLSGERFRMQNPMLLDRTSEIRREPAGVVGIIAPWNYPLAIPATQALTALFAGNAVVLKPSEQTPLLGERVGELLHDAGVPEDVLSVVQGPGEPTGKALVEADPDLLVFTGSVPTGRRVAAQASEQLTRTVLELGGKDPMLVLDDANVELAAGGAVWGAFTNAGQTCAAVERVYVHEAVAESFVERVVERTEALTVGPGVEHGTEVGPLIDDAAVDRVQAQVDDAVEKGATVQTGGGRLDELGPRFYAPTVLTDVDHTMTVMDEESFGPLLPIQTVANVDEAVALANDTPYGLTASVWTTRPERGDHVADRLRAGTVTVNDHTYTYAACETPWGGVQDSGLGHTHGRWGLEEVTELKHVNHARGGRGRSPWYYPYDDDFEALGEEGLELLYGSKLEGAKVLGPFLRRFFGSGDRP